jgi:hypothetical protein
MARGRIDLQASITISANGAQEVRFAGRVPGGAKSGLLVVTVTTTGVNSGASIGIATAADPGADAGSWAPLTGTATTLNVAGVKVAALSAMGDYIRWTVSGWTSGSFTCSIVVYTFDA